MNGAEPWNDPVEKRRADRRRDMEILRLASMEAAIHITEFIAGRLPNWKKPALEGLKDPVAALANLNRAIIQITLAEDRFDETGAERAERIRAEADAKVRAEQQADEARAGAEAALRRAENKRQVKGLVRAVSIPSIRIPFTEREKLLDDVFRELETEDDAVSAYNGDPAEAAADLCLRLGFAPKDINTKSILARRAALADLARAHIEALRGVTAPENDAVPDGAVLPLPQSAKAQGPPI